MNRFFAGSTTDGGSSGTAAATEMEVAPQQDQQPSPHLRNCPSLPPPQSASPGVGMTSPGGGYNSYMHYNNEDVLRGPTSSHLNQPLPPTQNISQHHPHQGNQQQGGSQQQIQSSSSFNEHNHLHPYNTRYPSLKVLEDAL